MSGFGTKRTCRFAAQMSAYDPKRTLALGYAHNEEAKAR
jgi:hypothetical protein